MLLREAVEAGVAAAAVHLVLRHGDDDDSDGDDIVGASEAKRLESLPHFVRQPLVPKAVTRAVEISSHRWLQQTIPLIFAGQLPCRFAALPCAQNKLTPTSRSYTIPCIFTVSFGQATHAFQYCPTLCFTSHRTIDILLTICLALNSFLLHYFYFFF